MQRGSAVFFGMLCAVTLLTATTSSLAADAETPHGGRAVGDHAFVGMTDLDKLVVFDLATGDAVPPTLDLGPEADYPSGVTMRPDGAEVWVVGQEGYGVVIIETAGRTVAEKIVLYVPFTGYKDVAFGLDGRTAYISGPATRVWVLDALNHSPIGSPIAITAADQAIGEMAVNPVNGLLYVLDNFRANLHVVDPDTHAVTTHAIGTNVSDVAVHPSGSTLYVGDAGSNQVHVLNAADLSSVTSIDVGTGPRAVDLTPDGTLLLVVNQYSESVSVIDTSTNLVTETIDFLWGCDPRDIDISADGARAYVTTGLVFGDHGLWVIDVATLAVVDRFGVSTDTYPQAVAVAPEIATPLIFADRFEVGDTRAWSASAP